ncbi:probable phospholipid-transporting ATPase VA isoform X2 [Chelonus insularis]|nr:probable phospholipid-transporting ATPase VA isoform X2 [Chelonus insularis]
MSQSNNKEQAVHEETGSLYVFPTIQATPRISSQNSSNTNLPSPTIMTSTLSSLTIKKDTVPIVKKEESSNVSKDHFSLSSSPSRGPRTHTRSASHAGVLATSSSTTGTGFQPLSHDSPANSSVTLSSGISRPSALKKPGHQRALSQGQAALGDMQPGLQSQVGHSRVGSKTDFILPPGHREGPRPSIAVTGGIKTPSFRGHSRQASRSESIYTIRRGVAPSWWRRLCAHLGLGHPPIEESSRLRTIVPNHLVPSKTPARLHPNGLYVDNSVRTTKYTTLTFLPRNLLEQFHRVANLYFVFIVLLNWVPAINAFGKEIAMIPVVFVLGVTAVKDFFEDRRRYASDRRVNNSMCRVYVSEIDRYAKVAWKDIKVGDVVHLSNNEVVPADILLLRSSDPQGCAFLDTCNLDGETNLKQRQVIRGFLDHQNSFQPSKFRSVIEVDQPTTKIYRFYGAVVHPNGTKIGVTTENLLLRECLLKNTDFVEGIVVYAGHETKAMLNNGGPRYKRSKLERQMNLDIVWCVVILVVLCIIGAVGCKFWLSAFSADDAPLFLPLLSSQNPSYEGMLTFWTFVIILQVMIPISLYVTMEMAKIGQVYHIGHDTELYDEVSQRKAECRALNITEELGQIQYVFSDKTGTLTENKMIFRRCTVGGQDYSHSGENENLTICTRLKEDLSIGNMRHRLQEFLILLAICNTVVVNTTPHHDTMNSSGVIEEPENNEVPIIKYKNQQLSGLQALTSASSSPSSSISSSAQLSAPPPSLLPSQLLPLSTLPLTTSFEEYDHGNTAASASSIFNKTPRSNRNFSNKIPRPKLLNIPTISGMLIRKNSPSEKARRNRNINSNSQDIYISNINSPPLTDDPTNIIYEAESPDELALVHAAKAYNIRLIKRTASSIIISLPDRSTLTFEVLHILPFDSNRKCMSIIVRHPLTNEITLYTKGADTTILSSLTESSSTGIFDDDQSSAISTSNTVNVVRQQLYTYARQGLRTLAMAKRSLTQNEFDVWNEKFMEIDKLATNDNRDRKLRECYASLESHLTLLGATGIEDKLQEGVPEAISTLIEAGIVVWLLTGDKPETAVNIAYLAKLFTPAMQLLRLQTRSKSITETLIRGYLEAIRLNETENERQQRALVVDGKTLTFILDPRSGLTNVFLELTQNCSSVLACRVTPLQKAYIVKTVKDKLRIRTLAIGDGANDVSMIQTADVGVGVSGREGTQAVMASDFAIAKFPMLTRLLLLHGQWSYDRLARMILYFFHKNAIFVFLIFWYQLYCGFSGTVMIDQMYLMFYNLFFTSLPPLAVGIYDRIASSKILLSYPELYSRGRLGLVYKPHSFWITITDALYQSIVIFFITEAAYHDSDVDIWEFGTTIITSCIIVMLIYAGLEVRSWTIIHIGTIIISLGIFFGFSFFYNVIYIGFMDLAKSYWVMPTAISRLSYWLTVILSSVLAILPRLVYRAVKNTVAPDMMLRAKMEYQIKQEAAKTTSMMMTPSQASTTTERYRRTSRNSIITTDCLRTSQHTR